MEVNTIQIDVFVSCPGDVADEKALVKTVIDRINVNLIYSGCPIILFFRDFSEIIGKSGVRPQQQINDSITGYNLYLGIMHMRFGSPTGAMNQITGKVFESGTEEEFEYAATRRSSESDGPEIYFFFKKPDSVSSTGTLEQLGKVIAFRERIEPNTWINAFEKERDFERLIFDLLTRLTTKLCLTAKTSVKQSYLEIGASFSNQVNDLHAYTLQLQQQIPTLEYYISRTVKEHKKGQPQLDMVSIAREEDNRQPLLNELLNNEKRIVLLGNAGSGKSVELQQLAKYYLNNDTPLFPIYKRFNTYTDGDIGDFLPAEWRQIKHEIALLILDGLDEIQPQHFNTAVRKIIDFSERNPAVRIIISCRTNFYDLPSNRSTGTLPGFKVFLLNDILPSEINKYVSKNYNIDGEEFIQEAYQQSFLDLIQKPFFLPILIKHFNDNRNLRTNRSAIINEFIESRIDLDQQHFKTTVNRPSTKQEILKLLQKVAFVMEIQGKNYLTQYELETVLSVKEELDQIKYFTAFNRNTQNGNWMFEHNNIQEYLASVVLGKESLEKLKEIISFPPTYTKVKPTWLNTISFFISTGENSKVKQLIDWLAENEPEIVIKFEPDRIGQELRIQLFKQVYNFYKEKDIWLNSNKFSNEEFSRFASIPEIVSFLVEEIQDTASSRITRYNAIRVFDYIDIDNLGEKFKQNLLQLLISTLEKPDNSPHDIHSILYSLSRLHIIDGESMKLIAEKYSRSVNEYIRAGLYKLLTASGLTDEYLDIFLDGLRLEISDPIDTREGSNLLDETWNLKEGLESITSVQGLKKVFEYLLKSENHKRIDLHDDIEILNKLVDNAVQVYSKDTTLLQPILDLFLEVSNHYEESYMKTLVRFFEHTKTKWDVFRFIWSNDTIQQHTKDYTIEKLLDENLVSQFINAYENREFTNQDVREFHKILNWKYPQRAENSEVLSDYEKKIEALSEIVFERPVVVDHHEIQVKRTQESFDVLFSDEAILAEVRRIFDHIAKEQITSDDIFRLGHYEPDEKVHFTRSVVQLIREFVSNGVNVSFEVIDNWVKNDPRFVKYQIHEIYEFVHGRRGEKLDISDKQIEFIKQWSLHTAENLDITTSVRNNGDSRFSIDWSATFLWYFFKEFNIKLPDEKLLDFTLFFETNSQSYSRSPKESIIANLEDYIDKNRIAERVVKNLEAGIDETHVWSSNAMYALDRSLSDAFPFIIRDLKLSDRSEYSRGQILESFFKLTKNYSALQEILTVIGKDPLRWHIIKLLAGVENQYQFLRGLLGNILDDETENKEEKLMAAGWLIAVDDLRGLDFISILIHQSDKPSMDFGLKLHSFKLITSTAAIPNLIALLKLARQSPFADDQFNSLESPVMEAFYKIALQSEGNFNMVKEAITKFIQENNDTIPNLQFVHFYIQRMEQQLYMKEATRYTIEEALNEFAKIDTNK